MPTVSVKQVADRWWVARLVLGPKLDFEFNGDSEQSARDGLRQQIQSVQMGISRQLIELLQRQEVLHEYLREGGAAELRKYG